MGDDGGEPSLQLLDFSSEFVEIVVELLNFDVHDVVLDFLELVDGLLELHEDLLDRLREGLSFGASKFDLLELVELNDGVGEMQDIVRSFKEGVQTDEEGVCGQLPSALGLGLVFEIGVLEFGTDINRSLELLTSILGVLILNGSENGGAGDTFSGLENDGITDLSNQHHESRRGIVESGFVPNHEDGVHDGDKEFMEVAEFLAGVRELVEVTGQGLQISRVIVGLDSSI